MNTTERDPILYHDGTAQAQRLSKSITPDYVAVDERTTEDIFAFIQAYARELNFYDLGNTVTGDWSPFFNQDINDIIKFIQDPSSFSGNKQKETQLSQPHLVLLLTFLQLLEHHKAQANTLTKKHLDFYYHEALQMTKKAAVPDEVSVVIQLDDRSGTYELKAGTLFYAGRDSEGNDLLYESQTDTLINHARVSQLKTLYNDKEILTLRDSRLREADVMELMELAVGDPEPGDSLPPYPPGINSLDDIITQWNDTNPDTVDQTIEDAITTLMKESIFIAQERQVNTKFKGVLNAAITDNLKALSSASDENRGIIPPSWTQTIAGTINNPDKADFGQLMLEVLYPEDVPNINFKDLGNDLLLIIQKSEAILFDLVSDILKKILDEDLDEDTKEILRTAIDNTLPGNSILDNLGDDEDEIEAERAVLKRVLNEAIAKANTQSNKAPLYEAVAAVLYTNDNTINQDIYKQAVRQVLGEADKKDLNAAIREAIEEQAGFAQEKVINDVLEDNPDIKAAIDDNSSSEDIANDLIDDHTEDIMIAATGDLLNPEIKTLITLAIQLNVEKITRKTIGRQDIAGATQTALASMLSPQLINNVTEDIQLGIVEEEVTAMPPPGELEIPARSSPGPAPGQILTPKGKLHQIDERRAVIKRIINDSLIKVTQQTLPFPDESLLITAIIKAIDEAREDVRKSVITVTDGTLGPGGTIPVEAKRNTDDTLEEIIIIAKSNSESAASDYCHNQLFMEKEELEYVLDDRPASDNEAWEACYTILEDAHEAKVIQQGKETLQYIREEGDKIAGGRGFQDISEYCWGQPGEEDPLPPYPEGANTLDDVYGQLQTGTLKEQQNASDYIRYELFLTETDFSCIMTVKNNPRATERDWDTTYEIMEVARIKNREIAIPEPGRDLYGNFYATPDATRTVFRKEYEDENSALRWKTFGANPLDEKNNTVTFADIGFAISSSVLAMEKGRRHITWTMAFEPQSYNEGDMELLFSGNNTTSDSEKFPFAFSLTTLETWINARADHVRYGICITRDPEKPYKLNEVSLSSGNIITKSGGDVFTSADEGGFLVWGGEREIEDENAIYIAAGSICRIDAIVSSSQVKVTPLAQIVPEDLRPQSHLVKKYSSGDIYFNALQFELSIDEKEEPIAPLEKSVGTFRWPVLKMLLRNILQPSGIQGIPDYYVNAYNQVENLRLKRSCIKVSVEGLNEFSLSNDEEILSTGSPFEPFGDNPEPGSAFYFAHTETAYKKLDTLRMDIEWSGAPADFKAHYENYWRADGIVEYPYMDNSGYTGRLKFIDRSMTIPLQYFYCTETFPSRDLNTTDEDFLLSGTPVSGITTADFKAEAEDGNILEIKDFTRNVTSQYIVINTEGRSIGEPFFVTYDDSYHPQKERLNVHKIGNRVTFYLEHGVKNSELRKIETVSWDESTPPVDIIIVEDSGAYRSARITVNSFSELTGSKITITYPAEGNPYLFSAPDATDTYTLSIRNISEVIAESNAGYEYERDNSLYTDDDVREWARFWEIGLNSPDFYHSDYNRLLSKEQVKTESDRNAERLLLNPPYTPKIRKLTIAYTALTTVETKDYTPGGDDDLLLYAHPFGFGEIFPLPETDEDEEPAYAFFPEYTDEGYLYIGFEDLKVPNNISVLFQMAEGSANPDLSKAELQWSYLSNNLWVPLGEENIPCDDTNGLVNTGIITFDIPEDATGNNTVLPEGLHWIRALTPLNSAAVCDTIGIKAQAVNAILSNPDEVPPGHLTELLPAGSINKTAEKTEEIEKVEQPYTSAKGKPEEQDLSFYIRVGERIRHKNRLLTLWDYEHMILEGFPDVYKAKCLFTNNKTNTEGQPGKVEAIVIPDIKGKLPFNPFEPKVPAGRLLEILEYLKNYLPQAVSLVVRNANFTPIKLRFAVRFRKGYNEGVYKERLNEDLKQYLSPWAYDQEAEITFGSKIYSNTVIDFLEGRPYVDYITRIKMFQAVPDENGEPEYTDVRLLQNGENVAVATMPDEILMSAMEHEIDIITTEYYDDEIYRGINYMKVELDFIVEFKT